MFVESPISIRDKSNSQMQSLFYKSHEMCWKNKLWEKLFKNIKRFFRHINIKNLSEYKKWWQLWDEEERKIELLSFNTKGTWRLLKKRCPWIALNTFCRKRSTKSQKMSNITLNIINLDFFLNNVNN